MKSITDVLDKNTFLSIALISMVASLLTLSIPIAAQTLINIIAFGKLLQPVLTLSLIVLIVMLALGALNVWQMVIVEVVQQKIMVKTSLDLTRQFTHLSLENFSTHHGPELVNRFFEVVTIQKALASLLSYGINLGLQAVLGLLLLLFYHPIFLVFDIFIVLSIVMIVFIPYRQGLDSAKKECTQKHQLGAWLEELLINRYLFRFGFYDRYATVKSDKYLVSFLKARNLHFKQLIKHQIGFYVLSALASCLLSGLGGYLVIINQLSLGQLVAAEIVLGALIYAFKRFGGLLENYYDLIASEGKLDTVLDLLTEEVKTDLDELFIPISSIKIKIPNGAEASVSADKPLLIYSPQADRCKAFIEALLGLRKTSAVELYVNNHLCNEDRRVALRHYVLLIRKPEWFSGSIYDNLIMNKPKVSAKIMMEHLHHFGLAEKIMQQPQGLNTIIYDWQNQFTELELTQLMVIRALLHQPQLLVIDRAFDGMEQGQVDQLMASLLTLKNTLLLVTTQYPTLQQFSNRLVLS